MKKLLISICVALIIASVALFSLWLLLNSSWTTDFITERTRQICGGELTIHKNPKISIFPFAIQLEASRLEKHDENMDIQFSAQETRILIDPFSLLQDQLRIKEIYLDEPALEIKMTSTSPVEQASQAVNTPAEADNPDKFSLILDRLMLRNGKFIFIKAGQILYLSQLNVAADHIGSRLETDLKCDFLGTYGTMQADSLIADIAGNMAIRTKIKYYTPNLTFRKTAITFTATENPTAIWLSPLMLDLAGVLNIEDLSLRLTSSSIKSPFCVLGLQGDYNKNENTFVGHATLTFNQETQTTQQDPKNPDIIFASPVKMNKDQISFPDIAINSGDSRGSGQLQLQLPHEHEKLKLNGKLSFGNLTLITKKEKDRTSTKSSSKLVAGATKKNITWPEIDLFFAAAGLNYDRFSARNMSFQFLGNDGRYDLKDLKFSWANGFASGSGHVNFPDQLIKLKTSGKKIEIGKALWELGVSGFKGGEAEYATNLASVGLDLKSIKENLTGDIKFISKNVKISLLEEIARFVSRFSNKENLIPEDIDNFSVNAHAENGKINVFAEAEANKLKASAKGDIVLATDAVSAQINLDILGMTLPIGLDGTVSKLSWRIEPNWFKKLF